jgi:hypothetical protein
MAASIIDDFKIKVNKFVTNLKSLDDDELIAYSSIVLGIIFIIIAILLW